MNLKELLRQPEGRMLEFKSSLPTGKQLAKTAIAFANGNGGKIIIGIDDKTHRVIGIKSEELFSLEEKISSIIYDNCEPLIIPHTRVEQFDDKHLLAITIYPGSDKPYHLKREGRDKGTYVRVGSSNRLADNKTIQELERQRLNISYDSVHLYNAKIEDLDISAIKEYIDLRRKVRDIPEEEISEKTLLKLNVIKREGENLYPTVGGLLLFGRSPESFFPFARIKCARFKGKDIDEFIDQQEISGRLKEQIEGAMKFFKRNVRRQAKIRGLYREEQYEYPEIVIREGIINAVVHRDYSIDGSDIKFAIFEDRIEITSPGVLPIGITLEDLGTGSSEIRNKVIARIFKDIGLIEEWGRGTRLMKNKMREYNLKEPIFSEGGNHFKVTLYGKERSKGQGITDIESEKILTFIDETGRIENKDVQRLLNVHRNTALNKLNILVELGKIERKGNGKRVYYVRCAQCA